MFRNSDVDSLPGSTRPPPASAMAADPGTFSRVLAVRLLALLGAASLAGTSGGCWGGATVLTGFGGGGTAGGGGGGSGATTGTTTTTGTSTSSVTSTCAVTPGGPTCGGF